MTEPITVFVNVFYPVNGACGAVFETRALADKMQGRGRIACLEILVTPGEGIKREEKANG